MYCRQSAHRSMKTTWIYFAAIFLAFAIVRATATTFYANASNTVPLAPYTNWQSAARNIQDAVDEASVPGSIVLVTNGTYNTGVRLQLGMTNRIAITNPIVVKSVNGPNTTTIQGRGPIGNNAIRCVFLGEGAVLDGFTLTDGATQNGSSGGVPIGLQAGGGIYCESSNSLVTNCVVIGNSGGLGGGIYGGTLYNCQITHNSAQYGGGLSDAIANYCVIKNNGLVAGNAGGGGAFGGILNNCLVVSNFTGGQGGGAVSASLNNCTIVSNSAAQFGGVVNCYVTNCIVYFNSGDPTTPNFGQSFNFNGNLKMKNCCTTPSPGLYGYSAGGTVTSQPSFVNFSAGNFHLQSNSPCINSGTNYFGTGQTDFDGNPRILGGAVDIGAYEFQTPGFTVPFVWSQQYGLSTDGSVDSDGDGMNNWQEWIAGVIPTNAASVLRLNSPTNAGPGLNVSWQSVNTRTYYLQRSTNLLASPAFTSIQSNLAGSAVTTTFTDTSATNGGPYFFRVGVQ